MHLPPVKFKSFHRDIYIPATPIEVTIVDCETSHATHLINPNLYIPQWYAFDLEINFNTFLRYTISLRHGDLTWEIKRRYKHIQDLHHVLVMFRASLNIPFPSKEHRRRRESFKNKAPISGKKKGALPRYLIDFPYPILYWIFSLSLRFPKKPEVLVFYDQMDARIKQLQEYLQNLLAINIYRYHPATVSTV